MTQDYITKEDLDHYEEVRTFERRTAFIGKVVKYYPNNGSPYVDIQPVNKYKVIQTEEIKLPLIIHEVPLLIPRTGASIDLYPVEKGDIGLCVVSDRCIDDFIDGKGDPMYPSNGRMKDKNDAEFILGGSPFSVEYSNTLPESCRAVIVDTNKSGLFMGDDKVPMPVNGGKLDLITMIDVINTVLLALDASVLGGSNAAKISEITTMLSKLKVQS